MDIRCVPYNGFLFAPYLPVIALVFVTVAYARCSGLSANPAMTAIPELFTW
jgi:hypothetical protein